METAEKFGEMEEALAQKGFDREQRRYMLKIFETVLRNFAKAQGVPVAKLVRDLQVKGTKAEDFFRTLAERKQQLEEEVPFQTKNEIGGLLTSSGFHLDARSVTAARRSMENNISSLPENVKSEFVKIFDAIVSGKAPDGFEKPVSAKNFITSMTSAGFERSGGGSVSAYRTIGGNTVRISDHSTSARTFAENGEAGGNNVSVVIEKSNTGKRFEGDPAVDVVEFVFNADNLTNGQMALIVHDIASFFASGEYTDHAGADFYHVSGSEEFKKAANAKIAADKAMFQSAEDSKRGAFDPVTRTLHLFEAADVSTFSHETIHYFMDMLRRFQVDGLLNEQYAKDLDALERFATDKDGNYDEEKIAVAWEHFLMKGKVDNPELRPIFRKFREWLTDLYRCTASYFKGNCATPEVRDIFNRWLAADELSLNEVGDNPVIQALMKYALLGMNNRDREALIPIAQKLRNRVLHRLRGQRLRGGKTVAERFVAEQPEDR